MTTVWGVHMGEHVGNQPIDEGYVAIGWQELGDLRAIPDDREAFKHALSAGLPEEKQTAVPVYAGILLRFVHEMKANDIVVYPSKHDRMVNIGRFTGEMDYVPEDANEYPNHRKVEWLGHFPRNEFSQSALNEIGAYITLFRVRKSAAEFLARVGQAVSEGAAPPLSEASEDAPDDDTATVSVSRQAEETTEDFVIRRIMAGLSGYEFEVLVAHLLECMGYTARVTQKSGDGGVDVIAHMDALGFQPPIVKVQCKRMTGQSGGPEVSQLLGALGEGEYALFVNLGSFSAQAKALERNKSKLRLIDGDEFVSLILANYSRLSGRYRSLLPLKQIYVPDLSKS